ncbi:MAG: hypothetical protein JRJ87_26880 [Deltaproteobacteria bacterium]|nr:hypothetical protein [Deltaproteobacteria bacterium]
MTDLAKLTKKFSDIKIVVLGDLVVDKYIYGTTRRISREAPVLIVRESYSILWPIEGFPQTAF